MKETKPVINYSYGRSFNVSRGHSYSKCCDCDFDIKCDCEIKCNGGENHKKEDAYREENLVINSLFDYWKKQLIASHIYEWRFASIDAIFVAGLLQKWYALEMKVKNIASDDYEEEGIFIIRNKYNALFAAVYSKIIEIQILFLYILTIAKTIPHSLFGILHPTLKMKSMFHSIQRK